MSGGDNEILRGGLGRRVQFLRQLIAIYVRVQWQLGVSALGLLVSKLHWCASQRWLPLSLILWFQEAFSWEYYALLALGMIEQTRKVFALLYIDAISGCSSKFKLV